MLNKEVFSENIPSKFKLSKQRRLEKLLARIRKKEVAATLKKIVRKKPA